jgi:hypothetical protein
MRSVSIARMTTVRHGPIMRMGDTTKMNMGEPDAIAGKISTAIEAD